MCSLDMCAKDGGCNCNRCSGEEFHDDDVYNIITRQEVEEWIINKDYEWKAESAFVAFGSRQLLTILLQLLVQDDTIDHWKIHWWTALASYLS